MSEVEIPLPSWTDPGAITTYITSFLAAVFAVVTAMTGHGEPAVVHALLPAIGVIVAGVAQMVLLITHRGVQKAVLVARSVAGIVNKLSEP